MLSSLQYRLPSGGMPLAHRGTVLAANGSARHRRCHDWYVCAGHLLPLCMRTELTKTTLERGKICLWSLTWPIHCSRYMLTSIIDHRFGAHHCGFDVRTKIAALANSQNMCLSCTWCVHDNPSAARDTAVWLKIPAGTFWTEMVPIRARYLCWWRGHVRGRSALPYNLSHQDRSDPIL
jgi:hypothetical protein